MGRSYIIDTGSVSHHVSAGAYLALRKTCRKSGGAGLGTGTGSA